MSSRAEISVARPAQYTSMRSAGSSSAAAAQKVMTSPVPTFTLAARSARPKPTRTPAKAVCSGTGGDLLQLARNQVEVVPVLDNRADGIGCRPGGQGGLAEETQPANPVHRPCPSGRLDQVQLAHPLHRRHDLAGQGLCGGRFPGQDDLQLPL